MTLVALNLALELLVRPVYSCTEVADKASAIAAFYQQGGSISQTSEEWTSIITGYIVRSHPKPEVAAQWAFALCQAGAGPPFENWI